MRRPPPKVRSLAGRAQFCCLVTVGCIFWLWVEESVWTLVQPPPRAVLRQYRSESHGSGGDGAATASSVRTVADIATERFAALARATRERGLANLSSVVGSSDGAAGADMFVTFGSASLLPFVNNWVGMLRAHGTWRLLVGALDDGMLAACEASGVPVLHISRPLGGGGSSSSSSSGGGYFRKDYQAFKKMGVAKTRFLSELLDAAPGGLWVCDADMVWLSPPPEGWIRQPSLLPADVLLSSDCLDLGADARGECGDWANLNTGVLYLRATLGARRLVERWRRGMGGIVIVSVLARP